MPFTEYRLTKEWRARRSRVLLRAGNRCELCNASGLLDVHHRTYDRYGDELLSDLIALCRPCHSKYHDVLPEAA
jgi:5-methylcytosine-specific restriction endonuclease McrA